jgi:hypothetical protein
MILTFRIAVLVSALMWLSACRSTPEATVYDSVADELLQAKGVLVVASTTDSQWFHENTVDSVVAEGTVSFDTEPPWLRKEHIPLLKRLFEQNQKDESLNWSPRDRRVQQLVGAYRAKPRSGDEADAMCFSAESMPAIGVASGGRMFRPYYSFSRIALSEDGQYAMLKLAYACAPMSGAHESILILRKSGVSWKIEGGTRLWVS